MEATTSAIFTPPGSTPNSPFKISNFALPEVNRLSELVRSEEIFGSFQEQIPHRNYSLNDRHVSLEGSEIATSLVGQKRVRPISMQVPPTPAKKGKLVRRYATTAQVAISVFKVLFNKAEQSRYETSFMILGVPAKLIPFADGTFVRAYGVLASEKIHQESENENLLVKLYHGQKTKFGEKALQKYMKISLENYDKAIALELPHAKIYNRETALNDKFYLVEKIPNEIDWQDGNHITQVISIFETVFKKQYPGDLSYANLRVTNEGTVVLIDFSEKNIDFSNTYKIYNFVLQMFRGWCRKIQETHRQDEGRSEAKKLLDQFFAVMPERERYFDNEKYEELLSEYFSIPSWLVNQSEI